MANNLSKTQIDKLGERLKKGDITEADLRLLDEYRLSFSEAYQFVVGAIRNEVGLEPTGRPAKSTTSITEKLHRESIRLSQIQDIAGCRVVVPGIKEQDKAVGDLHSLFQNSFVVDRRERPNNGYRAVHVIINAGGKLVEVQVRTLLQHGWAELSEKAADIIDPRIKYGGGDPQILDPILKTSELLALEESREMQFAKLEPRVDRLLSLQDIPPEDRQRIAELRELADGVRRRRLAVRAEVMVALTEMLANFLVTERDDAVSD